MKNLSKIEIVLHDLYINALWGKGTGGTGWTALEAWTAAWGDLLNAKFLPLLLNEFGAN